MMELWPFSHDRQWSRCDLNGSCERLEPDLLVRRYDVALPGLRARPFTLAFFSDATAFRIDHLEIAKRVFADLNAASFLPLDVHDLDVLRVALGVGTGLPGRPSAPAP